MNLPSIPYHDHTTNFWNHIIETLENQKTDQDSLASIVDMYARPDTIFRPMFLVQLKPQRLSIHYSVNDPEFFSDLIKSFPFLKSHQLQDNKTYNKIYKFSIPFPYLLFYYYTASITNDYQSVSPNFLDDSYKNKSPLYFSLTPYGSNLKLIGNFIPNFYRNVWASQGFNTGLCLGPREGLFSDCNSVYHYPYFMMESSLWSSHHGDADLRSSSTYKYLFESFKNFLKDTYNLSSKDLIFNFNSVDLMKDTGGHYSSYTSLFNLLWFHYLSCQSDDFWNFDSTFPTFPIESLAMRTKGFFHSSQNIFKPFAEDTAIEKIKTFYFDRLRN